MALNFIDTRHALYVGWVAGVALKHNLAFEPVLNDEGDFTDSLAYGVRPGLTITFIVPYPPDDWELGPA